MSNPFSNLSETAIVYAIIFIAIFWLKRKRQSSTHIPSGTTRNDWYDIQHFQENLSILSDQDMRQLLDAFIANHSCPMNLRMKANDFIVHFRGSQNSFHNPQAKLLLQNLCVRLDNMLNQQARTAEEWNALIQQTDTAYVAYRTHFYELTGS